MIATVSALALVAPSVCVTLYVLLPRASKWRRASFALLAYFAIVLFIWAGFLLWIKTESQLVVVRLVEQGLPASQIATPVVQDSILLHLLNNPWFLMAYLLMIASLAYWAWKRRRGAVA